MKKVVFLFFLAIIGTVAYSQQTMSLLNDASQRALRDAERGLYPNGCGGADDWRSNFVPNGTWRNACDQHDIEYGIPGFSKAEADNNLKNAMIAQGAPRWLANLYYNYVRDNGQSFYNNAQTQGRKAQELRGYSNPNADYPDNPYQRNYSLPSDNPYGY